MQVCQLRLQTFAVRLPRHPIHTRRRLFPQPAIGRPQQVDIDMVQQGGEPFLSSAPLLLSGTRSSPWDMLSRLGVRRMPGSIAFPSAPPLGSTNSAGSCPPLFAGFIATTKGSDFSCPCITGFGPPAFPVRAVLLQRPAMRSPGSQTEGFDGVPGSQTTRDRQGTRDIAPRRAAFRSTDSVGIPEHRAFAAQYLAHRHPCQRFVPGLASQQRITRGRCGSLYLSS